MKTLPFHTDEKRQQVSVDCADGRRSVYRYCAFCGHCAGIRVRGRMMPSPQRQALADMKTRAAGDDAMLQAAMMFNSFIREGTAIECDDDANQGFVTLFLY
ncbi:MAG: hypothetical protein LUO82_06050 [Methanomicrobiales archaeon]|nr:hypothetical protein [Methanomicrobiales archaeon]